MALKDLLCFLEDFFQRSTFRVLAVDREGKLAFVNPSMMKIIAPIDSEEKHIGNIPPDLSEKYFDVISSLQPVIGYKFKINGVYFQGEVLPLLWNGELKGAIGIFWEASDQDKVKEENKEYKECAKLLDIIFSSTYDGLWILNGEGRVLRLNKAAERISGIEAKDVIGKSIREMMADKLFDRSVTLEVLKRKTQVTLIQTVKGKKKVLLTGTPVFDDQHRIEFVVVNDRDITELNQLREQLEDSKALSRRYSTELKDLLMKNLNGLDVVFRSEKTRKILETSVRVAKVDSTILLLGESGVGKGLIARMIHNLSGRKEGPFIIVNCGSIPETLIESELFGYAKGAFTGANQRGKPGFLELANGGTLLLDEISEIPLNLQTKLLNFLETYEIFRVGGVDPIKLNIRFIAATNKDLGKMVKEGRFREDLFYRLSVIPIQVPSLRERQEDIPALIHFFLEKFNKQFNKNKIFTRSLINFLCKYSFPGNIRELSNLIERLVVLTENKKVGVKDLPTDLLNTKNESEACLFTDEKCSLKQMLAHTEKLMLEDSIRRYGSQREAAKALHMNQSTLARKLKKYRICSRVILHPQLQKNP
jgi:PAS domain S-box-containing protein